MQNSVSYPKTKLKSQLHLSTKRAAEENILILFHLQASSYVLRLLAETVEILQSISMLHTAQMCKFRATWAWGKHKSSAMQPIPGWGEVE